MEKGSRCKGLGQQRKNFPQFGFLGRYLKGHVVSLKGGNLSTCSGPSGIPYRLTIAASATIGSPSVIPYGPSVLGVSSVVTSDAHPIPPLNPYPLFPHESTASAGRRFSISAAIRARAAQIVNRRLLFSAERVSIRNTMSVSSCRERKGLQLGDTRVLEVFVE